MSRIDESLEVPAEEIYPASEDETGLSPGKGLWSRIAGRMRVPRRKGLAVVVAVAVAGAAVGLVLATAGKGSNTASGQTVIYSAVQARDLQKTEVETGTLGHKNLTTVAAQAPSFVSSVEAKDGDTMDAGQTLFSLGGRDAIAEKGSLPFFRPLGPGDVGADVLQLKQILAAAGDNPGTMDDVFTQQTQSALAEWQAQNHYPSATPASTEAATVALQQGTGYQIGAQSTAGLTIGPPGGATAASAASPATAGAPSGSSTGSVGAATAAYFVPALGTGTVGTRASFACPSPPQLTIAGGGTVAAGTSITLTITTNGNANASQDTDVYLSIGGSAQAGADYSPVDPVVLLSSGTDSTTVTINTLVNSTLQSNRFIEVTISPSPTGCYTVGEPSSAQITINEPTTQIVPTVTLTSATTYLTKGEPFPVMIGLSQPVTTALTVNLSYGGTAVNGIDFTPPAGNVVVPPGQTQLSVPIPTVSNNLVEGDRVLTVALASSAAYQIGSANSASVTIHDPNVPKVTITGTSTIQPGDSVTLTLTADQAPTSDLHVALSLAGSTAQPGTDYNPPDPVMVIPAGTTSVTFTIQTLVIQTIEPSRYIVVSVAQSPSSSYIVASPGSAVVTISGANAQTPLPIVTLQSPIAYLHKGNPFQVVIGLSEAIVTPVTIQLSYSGTALEGTDFIIPASSIVIPPGQTQITVPISTIVDNVVESDRTLTVTLAPSDEYQMGVPNAATVTITSSVVPTLTISTGSSSITEGGDAIFTITADQAPSKDTSVNFVLAGTAQPGLDYVPLAGTVILRAGQKSVTVTFQSIKKDVMFEPTDMIVADWPVRIGQVYIKQGNEVTTGEPLVDLTQPDVSVTLQASPSDFNQLALGQKCTMTISGSQVELTGTISELDSSPTLLSGSGSGGSAQQVFEGQIEVSDLAKGDANADGATVSITVTTQEASNALSVPIAAVKQNGTGQDVVRVVDLHHGGKLTEVPVTTGLTSGSYVQVTGGLHLGQTVVVTVDRSTS